jgi:hypothetical protein
VAVNMRTPEVETDDCLPQRVNCSRCLGCFTGQYKRVRACIPLDAPRPGNSPLRPPLAERPVGSAPAPLARVKVLEPVPVVPLDIADAPAQVRAWWAVGVSPRVIAARLNSWKVPPTRGSKWFRSSVWELLLDAPRESAQVKRDA